ncbi:MAG: hypothetical protein AYL29_015360 [Candidatus Bathyarchaeota archaeon B24]|nr:MAG: hypothetical protein AYL29_015360 [Candidatus Bathyarchaeota archaeon B24]
MVYRYALKYWRMLFDFGRASMLHGFSKSKRHNVMVALSALAKYLGCMSLFKALKEEAGLKWEGFSSFESFIRAYRSNPETLLNWLSELKVRVEWRYYFPLAYMALTGLRVSEACMSLTLIAEHGVEGYYNPETSCLEHFRFGNLFLRRRKNAFISPVSKHLLSLAESYGTPITYYTLKCKFRRDGVPIRMGELRGFNATWLRTHGIEPELIDMVQGRIRKTVFTRFYFKPGFTQLTQRILKALQPLEVRLLG